MADPAPAAGAHQNQPPEELRGAAVILYDGVCGLCNRLNRFVLARDREDRFRFAPLQGNLAREVLARYGKDPRDLDTVYLILDWGGPGERLLSKARAVLTILDGLGRFWKAPALLRVLPAPFLDLFYVLVARNRYRFFGKHASCPIPEPRHRKKFIDLP